MNLYTIKRQELSRIFFFLWSLSTKKTACKNTLSLIQRTEKPFVRLLLLMFAFEALKFKLRALPPLAVPDQYRPLLPTVLSVAELRLRLPATDR